jgi:hypothetical protein
MHVVKKRREDAIYGIKKSHTKSHSWNLECAARAAAHFIPFFVQIISELNLHVGLRSFLALHTSRQWEISRFEKKIMYVPFERLFLLLLFLNREAGLIQKKTERSWLLRVLACVLLKQESDRASFVFIYLSERNEREMQEEFIFTCRSYIRI